jgi:predicted RNase H-like nuclease (RuvC/YqgF family)
LPLDRRTEEEFAMSYRWHVLGLSVLVVAALAARAAAADPELKKTDSQKLDEVLQQLKDLKTTVDNLEKVRQELKDLEKRDELRTEKTRELTNERIDRVQDRIGGLETRIKRMESDLEAMRAQTTTANRPSGYAGLGNGSSPPGVVRLRNTFPDEVSVVVNGVSHRLLPGDSELVQLPAGPFTYEVLRIQPPKTVDLRPSETFTITVFPQ